MTADSQATDAKSVSTFAKLKKNMAKKSQAVLLLVAAIGVTWMGYITPRAKIDQDEAISVLDEIGATLVGTVQDTVYSANFSYDSVEIKGGGFSQYIVVHQPSFFYAEASGKGPYVTFSAEDVILQPENGTLNPARRGQRFRLIFDAPLKITKGDYFVRIIPKKPLSVNFVYAADSEIGIDLVEDKETFDIALEAGNNDTQQVWRTYDMTFVGVSEAMDANVSLMLDLELKDEDGEKNTYTTFNCELPNLSVTSAQGTLSAELLQIEYDSYPDQGKNTQNYSTNGSKLVYKGMGNDLTINQFDAAFTKYTPVDASGGYPFNAEGSLSFDSISNDIKMEFDAKGENLRFVAGEEVPYGTVSMYIASAQMLLDSFEGAGLISQHMRDIVLKALDGAGTQHMSEARGELGDYDLKITREPGEAFMVGKLTMEELMASLLSDVLPGVSWEPKEKVVPAVPKPAQEAPDKDAPAQAN